MLAVERIGLTLPELWAIDRFALDVAFADEATLVPLRADFDGWAAGIPELARAIVAITSDMIVTAPAGERIRALGWTPKLSIQKGVINTLEYLIANPWVVEARP